MSDTNTQIGPVDLTVGTDLKAILHRSSVPLLLFSGVLFSLLLLSYTILLPKFTQLHRGDGTAMSPKQIAQYERQLAADLITQEENRVRLVLPIQDETYGVLKEQKQQTPSLVDIQEQLNQAASRAGESADTVKLMQLSLVDNHVTATGDVQGVGTRSMTVLAAFIEQVEKLPMVHELVRPSFTRKELPGGGYHSPFTLSFTVSLVSARDDSSLQK